MPPDSMQSKPASKPARPRTAGLASAWPSSCQNVVSPSQGSDRSCGAREKYSAARTSACPAKTCLMEARQPVEIMGSRCDIGRRRFLNCSSRCFMVAPPKASAQMEHSCLETSLQRRSRLARQHRRRRQGRLHSRRAKHNFNPTWPWFSPRRKHRPPASQMTRACIPIATLRSWPCSETGLSSPSVTRQSCVVE